MKTGSSSCKTAIVTGASSGIGKAIANMLLEEGFAVFGFGRKFEGSERFITVEGDLLYTEDTVKKMKKIFDENDVRVLVNSAGTAFYGLHENVSPENIANMVRTNLELPMILSGIALDRFKKNCGGYIINISSVTADGINTHGAAYGATKAGLSSFSGSIYEEARKHNIVVTDISPDMTATNLYRNADFSCSDDEGAYLEPEDVSQAVRSVLNMRDGANITKMKIQPRYRRIRKR